MKITFIIPLALVMAFTACKKEETNKVSEDEATETLTQSVETSNAGMAEQTMEASEIATALLESPLCGVSEDSTVTKVYTSASRTLDYVFNWGWVINCTAGIPSNITFNYSSTGTYDVPRMSSADNATGEIVLTQLLPSDTEYLATINYTRNGSQNSKIGKNTSFTSVITLTGSDITINKESNEITGGTMTVSITGVADGGDAFSYGGNLVFNGGGSATITLDNGSVYEVSI